MSSISVDKLLALPERRRLEIAEQLWLSVADERELPVPAEHKQLLKKRLADYRAGKLKTLSHAELMRRVKKA
jgi:putative addiction module component (TIGR02574 family)